jgi:hypothetical protein
MIKGGRMPFSKQNVPILAGCMLQALVLILMPSKNLLAQDLTQPVAKVKDVLLMQADLEKALNQIMPATRFHGGMHSRKRDSFRPQAMELLCPMNGSKTIVVVMCYIVVHMSS